MFVVFCIINILLYIDFYLLSINPFERIWKRKELYVAIIVPSIIAFMILENFYHQFSSHYMTGIGSFTLFFIAIFAVLLIIKGLRQKTD